MLTTRCLVLVAFLEACLTFTVTNGFRPLYFVDAKTKSKRQTLCQLNFKDCGSVAGSLKSVSVNSTCNSGIAVLKKGTSVLVDFAFTSAQDESVLTAAAYGKIGDLPYVKFPLNNPDACLNSGLTCPIKGGVQQDYLPVLDILSAYPSVNVVVKWLLQNKDGKDVFCALIPATITS